jgi:glycyl-tRNA synthetase beta subunit
MSLVKWFKLFHAKQPHANAPELSNSNNDTPPVVKPDTSLSQRLDTMFQLHETILQQYQTATETHETILQRFETLLQSNETLSETVQTLVTQKQLDPSNKTQVDLTKLGDGRKKPRTEKQVAAFRRNFAQATPNTKNQHKLYDGAFGKK